MSGDLIGRILLSQYEVEAFIAAGGMGAVYRVWDLKRQVRLAMKVLHPDLADDPSILKRFKREANALKKLAHPNIVPFYGLHQSGPLIFLLEQYIDGPSLKEVLREHKGKPLAVEEALVYLKAVSAALGYAHAHGVVHCDVKPGNVMVDRGGSIYLSDFGIARHAESTTTTVAFAGTAAYMAPEQVRGEAVTAQTDVYALGVMLYEMLTGRRPFRGEERGTDSEGGTAAERIRYAHLHLDPPDPRQYNAALPEGIVRVILKALAKDPAERFESVGALCAAACAAVGVVPSELPDRVSLPQTLTAPLPVTKLRGSTEDAAKPVEERSARGRGGMLVSVSGLLRLGVTALLTAAAVTSLLLLVISMGLSKIAENVIAASNWWLIARQVRYSESDLSAATIYGLRLVLPGFFETAVVDLIPPDEFSIDVTTYNTETRIRLSGSVRLSPDGYPTIAIHKLNGVPLTVFGAVISSGINRGFSRAFREAGASITELVIGDREMLITVQSTASEAARPFPSGNSPPSAVPTPITTPNAYVLATEGVRTNADWTPYIETINGVEMALVPAGCFVMGSDEGSDNERPAHQVCFERPFWIDVYEVTNEAYGSVGCKSFSYEPRQPRNCVNWTDALEHCKSRGARLPTEAEWEYAARGPDGLVYPWGNEFIRENVVWLSASRPEEVGNRPAGRSWVGAYDLSGNVGEWVNDWYSSYPNQKLVNPQGPVTGDYHVLRGGSWSSTSAYFLRSVSRIRGDPSLEAVDIGFRCALSYP